MTSITKNLSLQTPAGRCGFVEMEYRTGSTVFPRQWELYVAGRGFPVGGEHILAVCLFMVGVAVLSVRLRRSRE